MGSQTPSDLTRRLLDWFIDHARDLPWRNNRTPYRVWVAEVMLQQTQVDTVIPYYERFLVQFPDLETLALAPLEKVLKSWEGLGYYARARNLHAAAGKIIAEHQGRLPDQVASLRNLPGFGPYTTGAVASIAFGLPVAAIDGNVRRVLTRLFAIEGDPQRAPARRRVESRAADLVPRDQPGLFNEALMELGATICLPRSPLCPQCPLVDLCRARREGREQDFPARTPRKKVPHYDVSAAVLLREDKVLVARRNLDDFLGGLWEFPGGKREDGESLQECLAREMREELDIEVAVGEQILVLKHAYTHFRITLHAFLCHLKAGTPRCLDCADFRWVRPKALDNLPMSAADRRIAHTVQQRFQDPSPVPPESP